MMRRLLVGLVVPAVLVACSNTTDTPAAPASTPPEPEPVPLTYAMTGLEAPQSWKPHPVVVVKIDNTLAGRPQVGVGQADMVIEEPVEGGLTRLAAFFESASPESVGPVRSIRASDVGLVSPVNPIVVASGGSPEALAAYSKADITLIDESSGELVRDPSRAAPYNVFVDLTQLKRDSLGKDPKKPYFDFGITKLPATASVKEVRLTFSPSHSETWRWNGKGWWEQEGQTFRPKTLLALDVRTVDTGLRDAAGTPIPEVITTGSGGGFMMTDGKARQILWQKSSPTAPYEFTTQAGLVISIPPGRTWLALMEKKSGQVTLS